MRRILFDKNVPYPLKNYLADWQVKTAEEEGWGQISNGDLIGAAEAAGYDVLLTCDQNIRYQQNLARHKISLLVLGSNIWPGVQLKVDTVVEALKRAVPGSFEFVRIPSLPRRRHVRDR